LVDLGVRGARFAAASPTSVPVARFAAASPVSVPAAVASRAARQRT
jgi:hypothetical protein